ncbi:HipA-like protein [Candidatus Koribacter versatilis Ellin345]|uniref:HipA-like protein n=1 Tax=Koribacter versatilis (strain Ellin345) TaxID=204669 RepID=Q1IVD9_KORVE|nr:type II toxin-antitoxin system HipA family toxin [Candidatus Koribacter versatilis]ABF39161.1 HipA-like protein [Candidatus Koribacter versatilis Ellin345]
MPRHATYAPLNVFINSRRVGVLRRESSGAVEFRYSDEWLAWAHAFPISLSLPMRPEKYVGAPVLAVLENLLPDNEAILRRVAERVHANGTDAYNLLSAIGRDCVGALQFRPEDTQPGPAGVVDGEELEGHGIEQLLANLTRAPLGLTTDDDFRISIAGAQEKTALLRWNDRWWKPLGATATTHIFKRPIGMAHNIDLSDSVENEYLCLRLTKALGIPVANAEIEQFGKQKALVIERFDRLWTSDKRLLRIPQEDCCQAFSMPPTKKYEAEGGPGAVKILTLLNASDTPTDDQKMFLKALITFWLLGAIDGHAKNFSIRIAEGGRFQLSPLYDIVSGQPAVAAGSIRHNQFKLAMAVGKNRQYVVNSIAPRHFAETAAQAGVGRVVVEEAMQELHSAAVKNVSHVFKDLPSKFPMKMAEAVQKGFDRRLKMLSA